MTEQISVRKRRGNFTIISNTAINDERLSLAAKGFLLYIVSRPDGWVFHPKHLMKVCHIGKDKYYGIVRQLKSNGYLNVEQIKGADGKYCGTNWEILDNPCAENPDAAEPVSGKPDQLVKINTLKSTEPILEDGSDSFDYLRANEDEIEKFSESKPEKIDAHFEELWRILPRRRDRRESMRLFKKAVASGVDPELIKRAARKYATETKSTRIQYVATSANWLDQRRWEDYGSLTTQHSAKTGERAAFWAKNIKAGKYIPPSAFTVQVAKVMVRDHSISADHLRDLGFAI